MSTDDLPKPVTWIWEARGVVHDPLYTADQLRTAIAAERESWRSRFRESIAVAEKQHEAELSTMREQLAAVSLALSEAVSFQSAPRGPSIHDFGRWRRLVDAVARSGGGK